MATKRRIGRFLMVGVVLSLAVLTCFASGVVADGEVTHTVKWGQTLSWIAWMYKTTVQEIVDANGLSNANVIYAGQKLTIPADTEATVVHTVQAGETLLAIAAKYGVSVWAIARRNGMWNINLVFVGQELVIPLSEQVVPPIVEPTAPEVQEAIIIESPSPNDAVSNPVIVQGWGSAFENTLVVDILDGSGVTIGQGFAMVDAEIGQVGPFSGTISFTPPAAEELGRVAVYSVSARDGAIEHLNSVTISLQP